MRRPDRKNKGLETRDAAACLSLLYQPRERTLLAFLGRDDVQRALVKIGALKRVGGVA